MANWLFLSVSKLLWYFFLLLPINCYLFFRVLALGSLSHIISPYDVNILKITFTYYICWVTDCKLLCFNKIKQKNIMYILWARQSSVASVIPRIKSFLLAFTTQSIIIIIKISILLSAITAIIKLFVSLLFSPPWNYDFYK